MVHFSQQIGQSELNQQQKESESKGTLPSSAKAPGAARSPVADSGRIGPVEAYGNLAKDIKISVSQGRTATVPASTLVDHLLRGKDDFVEVRSTKDRRISKQELAGAYEQLCNEAIDELGARGERVLDQAPRLMEVLAKSAVNLGEAEQKALLETQKLSLRALLAIGVYTAEIARTLITAHVCHDDEIVYDYENVIEAALSRAAPGARSILEEVLAVHLQSDNDQIFKRSVAFVQAFGSESSLTGAAIVKSFEKSESQGSWRSSNLVFYRLLSNFLGESADIQDMVNKRLRSASSDDRRLALDIIAGAKESASNFIPQLKELATSAREENEREVISETLLCLDSSLAPFVLALYPEGKDQVKWMRYIGDIRN